MPIDVFMWIAGILLGVIGALLVLMWTTLSRSLEKLTDALGRLDEKLTAEMLERSKLSIEIRDRVRDEQRLCLQGCTKEWERLDTKLDGVRDDLNDCRDTLSGFEAGLVPRHELRTIMVDCINAAKGLKNG